MRMRQPGVDRWGSSELSDHDKRMAEGRGCQLGAATTTLNARARQTV
jgi:hypothetical protein